MRTMKGCLWIRPARSFGDGMVESWGDGGEEMVIWGD